MTVKRWIVVALVTTAPCWPGAGTARADTYAWTDESGAKHLTDRLSAVPESYRDRAIRVGGAPSAQTPPPASSAAQAPPAGGAGSPSSENDEIFRMGEAPVARAPVPSAQSAEPAAGQPAATTDQEGHDQHWWQTQMASALNRQSRAADAVRTLEANKIVLSYGQPSDKTKYRDDLSKAKKEQEAANKAVADLEKHAKSAGAPASWLLLPGMEPVSSTKGGVEKSQP